MRTIKLGALVETGKPGQDEYDEGKVIQINKDGTVAIKWVLSDHTYNEDPKDLSIRVTLEEN